MNEESSPVRKRFAVFYISRDQKDIRDDKFNFLPLASDIIRSFYEQFPTEKLQ